MSFTLVIPAKAGTQAHGTVLLSCLGPRFRGDDKGKRG